MTKLRCFDFTFGFLYLQENLEKVVNIDLGEKCKL